MCDVMPASPPSAGNSSRRVSFRSISVAVLGPKPERSPRAHPIEMEGAQGALKCVPETQDA